MFCDLLPPIEPLYMLFYYVLCLHAQVRANRRSEVYLSPPGK